jgi:LPS-assembly lipoprotein
MLSSDRRAFLACRCGPARLRTAWGAVDLRLCLWRRRREHATASGASRNTREGFSLRTRLETGRVERGDYLLTIQLEIRRRRNRHQFRTKTLTALTYRAGRRGSLAPEPGNDTPLASGIAQTFTAYSFGTTVATRSLGRRARDRYCPRG